MSSSLWIPHWAPLKLEEALKLRVGLHPEILEGLSRCPMSNEDLFAQGTQGPTGFQGLTGTAPKVSQGIVPCGVCLKQ